MLFFIGPHTRRGDTGLCLGFEYGRDTRRMSYNLRLYFGRREYVFFDKPDELRPL